MSETVLPEIEEYIMGRVSNSDDASSLNGYTVVELFNKDDERLDTEIQPVGVIDEEGQERKVDFGYIKTGKMGSADPMFFRSEKYDLANFSEAEKRLIEKIINTYTGIKNKNKYDIQMELPVENPIDWSQSFCNGQAVFSSVSKKFTSEIRSEIIENVQNESDNISRNGEKIIDIAEDLLYSTIPDQVRENLGENLVYAPVIFININLRAKEFNAESPLLSKKEATTWVLSKHHITPDLISKMTGYTDVKKTLNKCVQKQVQAEMTQESFDKVNSYDMCNEFPKFVSTDTIETPRGETEEYKKRVRELFDINKELTNVLAYCPKCNYDAGNCTHLHKFDFDSEDSSWPDVQNKFYLGRYNDFYDHTKNNRGNLLVECPQCGHVDIERYFRLEWQDQHGKVVQHKRPTKFYHLVILED